MGWTHIPDMDISSSADDNPFAAPHQHPQRKISVKLSMMSGFVKKWKN